jgi:hypothetical protein
VHGHVVGSHPAGRVQPGFVLDHTHLPPSFGVSLHVGDDATGNGIGGQCYTTNDVAEAMLTNCSQAVQ